MHQIYALPNAINRKIEYDQEMHNHILLQACADPEGGGGGGEGAGGTDPLRGYKTHLLHVFLIFLDQYKQPYTDPYFPK